MRTGFTGFIKVELPYKCTPIYVETDTAVLAELSGEAYSKWSRSKQSRLSAGDRLPHMSELFLEKGSAAVIRVNDNTAVHLTAPDDENTGFQVVCMPIYLEEMKKAAAPSKE
jgi:hypothetical protein